MFSIYRFSAMILTVFMLLSVSLPACAPLPTVQPTASPTQTDTPIPLTETPTLRPTRTAKPVRTPRPTQTIVPNEIELYQAATLVSSLENASRDEVAEALLRKWLKYYKTDLVSENLRIKDYKIERVKAWDGYCPTKDKNITKFIVEVDFSVQLVVVLYSPWNAGSGEDGPNNWIYHKGGFASVSEANGVYTLGWEGIPPCSG